MAESINAVFKSKTSVTGKLNVQNQTGIYGLEVYFHGKYAGIVHINATKMMEIG
ncbi:MAG: hypothetical protein NWE90_07385 [Candidatus Bathyarchaeota archaeon]|nr:hypothetical protein [Candidatus Bathyarchaeota archaeon]